MITMREIADSDFILFYHDQPAQQARDLLTMLHPTSVIIHHLTQTGENYYYLYLTEHLRAEIAQAADAITLGQELSLNPQTAVPAVDLYANAEAAPFRCVVTDDDRVVAFYDALLPPFFDTRGEGRRSGDARPGEQEPSVVRSLKATIADQIPLNQTTSLLVSLVHDPGLDSAMPIAVPLGTIVDIVVDAQRGFSIDGRREGRLIVTDEEEGLPLQFKLHATSVGPSQVRVYCFHDGLPLGAVTLTPTIIPSNQAADDRRSVSSQALSPFATAHPDLTLLIFERIEQGQTSITFLILALDSRLGLNFKPFGPIRLQMNPAQYFEAFFSDIEGLNMSRAEEQAIATSILERKGASLFQDVVPPDLQALLWSLRDRIRTVNIQSDEPWIPWELLKLHGEENGEHLEGPFLCEAYELTRWHPGIPRCPQLRFNHIGLVVPADSGLAYAQEEQNYVLGLATGRRKVEQVPARYLSVAEALQSGIYDGWHFIGHARFEASDPNRSAINLEQGETLRPEFISGKLRNLGKGQPLVFLNACQTGQAAASLTGTGGWARRFLDAGAGGFVGTLWSIRDQAAFVFAKAFYDQLLAGVPIGRATKEARATVREMNDPSWLAYTVFADPLATVQVSG